MNYSSNGSVSANSYIQAQIKLNRNQTRKWIPNYSNALRRGQERVEMLTRNRTRQNVRRSTSPGRVRNMIQKLTPVMRKQTRRKY